jgi:antitoxin YefM
VNSNLAPNRSSALRSYRQQQFLDFLHPRLGVFLGESRKFSAERDEVAVDGRCVWTLCCPYMKAITYTAAREGLASTMDKVCRDRSPIIITRNRDQSVVMLSLADYEQLEETAYLLRSPANARRLLSAIGSLERGKGRQRKIDLEP